jgi:hypothetical protein
MSLARARALAIVGALVVAALILVVMAVVKDKQSTASYAGGHCQPGQVRISTRLPNPDKIHLKVYNGTGTPNPDQRDAKRNPIIGAVSGLGGQVTDDFRNRGFVVDTVGDHPEKFDHVAKLHYGPKTVAAASVVRAYFLDETDDGGFDLKYNEDTVEVTLGSGFKQLGTKTEVNQKIAQLGNPSPPPGTCDSGE